ncbi:hypothetical protein [Roseovarius sp. E0-M6]|uniref:hypothetical protein n=1 Tax=Roseovarius sp. E0-M6 TaxID=3127118 RepID=UPI0030103E77
MFAKFNGERNYLWRVDKHESDVPESFLMKTRAKKAALKFLKSNAQAWPPGDCRH